MLCCDLLPVHCSWWPNHSPHSCSVPPAMVSLSSQAPNQILIMRSLFPPSCFTRKLVWGHSTITSTTAGPGEATEHAPGTFRLLGQVPHAEGPSLHLPLAPLQLFAEQHTCVLLSPKNRTQGVSLSSTQLNMLWWIWHKLEDGWRLGCASPGSCPILKSWSPCGGLLPPRYFSPFLLPCYLALLSLTSTVSVTCWIHFGVC